MGAPAMGVVRWASCDAVRRLRLAEIVVVIRYQSSVIRILMQMGAPSPASVVHEAGYIYYISEQRVRSWNSVLNVAACWC